MSRIISVLLCALLLSACSWLGLGDKSTEQNPTDDSEAANLDEADDKEKNEPKKLSSIDETVKFKKVWRKSVGNGEEVYLATLHPGVDKTNVYAANNEGRVSAWSSEDGKRLWRTDLDLNLSGGVGAGSGLVAVGSAKGEVIALESTSGEERWRVSLTSEILSAPVMNSRVMVVQTQDGKLYALSLDNGQELWRFVTDMPVLTLRGTPSPLITGRMVIAGFASGKIVALEAANGAQLWEAKLATGDGKTELERMVDVNTPVLGGDVLYATSYQGRTGAFSRGAGRELWAHEGSSYQAPAFGPGRVYVVDTDGQVLGLRSSSGRPQWTNTDLLRRGLIGPLVLGEHVVVADSEGYLHALSKVDGTLVGRVKVDGDGISMLMVSDGDKVFVQDNDGDLSAYKLLSK